MGSWKIFSNDIKNIVTNWVIAVLIGGLIFIPSLYAWFNIVASWDPYGKTNQIPVGIVNEDKGGVILDQEIHVGDDLVKSLKKNKAMDWHFVNREKAMEKLKYGEFFAVIIIPEDFSKRLGTVTSDNPQKAEVEYFVNEKINAIAPKITQKGASVIVQQISSNFISTVNGTIFKIFNQLGIELEKNLPDIKKFENYIFLLEEKLPEIQRILNESSSDADFVEGLIDKVQGYIPEVKDITTNGLETIDKTTQLLQKAEDQFNEIAPTLEDDFLKIQNMIKQVNEFVNKIDSSSIDLTNLKDMNTSINEKLEEMIQSTEKIKNTVSILLDKLPSDSNGNSPEEIDNSNLKDNIDNIFEQINTLEQNLQKILDQTETLSSLINDKQLQIDDILSGIKDRTQTINNKVNTFITEYNESIKPFVKEEIPKTKNQLTNAKRILLEVQTTLPEVEQLLSRTKNNLADGKKMLQYANSELPYVQDKVSELANKLRTIQGETDINKIIQLLQNDPEAEKGFFAEPVVLNENSIFAIANYGTGMTPFYTVLAIWVGGLLLISVLSTDIHEKEKFSGRQIYFGRFFTFMTIGFFQSLIVTLGDLFIIQVDVKSPFWFVIFGLICSLVFVLIIYTLVSVFGDVGKALAIIMIVLQIAGSGGTYPVVLLPKFFQMISPFLPFTYAIDIMREAVGGIVWKKVYYDLTFLFIFGLIALIIGVFFKEAINRITDKFKEKVKSSDLFH